jgi:hypothetical protein
MAAVLEAGEPDPGEVEGDEDEGDVDRRLVGLADEADAPEGVGGHHHAAQGDDDERQQERHHHRSARRVVADVAAGLEGKRVLEEAEHRRGRVEKVGEAGVARADEAPRHAEGDEADDDVAGELVHRQDLLARRPGGDEGRDQRPVEEADERVPHRDGRRPDLPAGVRSLVEDERHSSFSPSVPTRVPSTGFITSSRRLPSLIA